MRDSLEAQRFASLLISCTVTSVPLHVQPITGLSSGLFDRLFYYPLQSVDLENSLHLTSNTLQNSNVSAGDSDDRLAKLSSKTLCQVINAVWTGAACRG